MPYLTIDPTDIGREYHEVIRVNSQSGKGGVAYILRADYGLDLPRSLQAEFSKIAQERMDAEGKELTSPELWILFRQAFLLDDPPMTLVKQQVIPSSPDNRELFASLRKADGSTMTIEGEGNGPIDAFRRCAEEGVQCRVLVHRLSRTAPVRTRRECNRGELCGDPGRARPRIHGVGIDPNIVMASLKATLAAVLRLMRARGQGAFVRRGDAALGGALSFLLVSRCSRTRLGAGNRDT